MKIYKRKQNSSAFKNTHRDKTKRRRENKKALCNVLSLSPTAPPTTKMSVQSLGKALRRLKTVLPASPSKKKIVLLLSQRRYFIIHARKTGCTDHKR